MFENNIFLKRIIIVVSCYIFFINTNLWADIQNNKPINSLQKNEKGNAEQQINNLDNLINLNIQNKRYKFALSLAKKSIQMKTKHYGAGTMGEASGFYNIAYIYNAMGSYRDALFYYQKTRKPMEKFYGINSAETKQLYEYLIAMTAQMGKYDEALKWAQKTQVILQYTTGTQTDNYVTVMRDVAFLYGKMGKAEKAISAFNKAITHANTVKGSELMRYQMYNDLADIYAQQNNDKKAIELLSNIDTLLDKKPEFKEYLQATYNRIATIYYSNKDFKQALVWFNKSFDMKKSFYPAAHIEIARSYKNIASSYLGMGRTQQALKFMKQSESMLKQMLDASHPELIETQSSLAQVYVDMGDYKTAIPLFKYTLEKTELTQGQNNEALAVRHNNLGMAYLTIGDYPKAEKEVIAALTIRKNLFGEDAIEVAQDYTAMGMLYYQQKKIDKALEFYKKSLVIQQKKYGAEHYYLAEIYNNISLVYMLKKDFSKATTYAKKAHTISKKHYGDNHLITMTAFASVGNILKKQRKYQQALPIYQKVYQKDKKVLGHYHENTLTSVHNLAVLYGEMNLPLSAFSYAKLANNQVTKKRERLFTQLDQKGKQAFVKLYQNYIDTVLHTGHQLMAFQKTKALKPTSKELAFTGTLFPIENNKVRQQIMTQWMNNKGVLYDNENMLAMLVNNQNHINASDVALIRKIEEDKVKLNKLYKEIEVNPTDRNRVHNKINKLEELISQSENELAKNVSLIRSELGLKKLTVKDLAGTLTSEQLYIDYAKTNIGYYFFTLNKDQEIDFVYISKKNSKQIESLVQNYHGYINLFQELKSYYSLTPKVKAEIEQKSSDALKQLYQILFAKKDVFQGKKELVVSADGALRLLPFEALIDEQGDYLIEKKNIIYIPSAKEWMRLKRRNKKLPNLDMTIFYNPNYLAQVKDAVSANKHSDDDMLSRFATRNTRLLDLAFKDLPGTKTEGDNILKLIKENTHNEIQVFKRDNATKDNLLTAKPSQFVHIASHGFFINDQNTTNPMLKSGLALSGAQQGTFTGKVTALELTGMKLFGTGTVILSACETGKVDIDDTQVVSGLTKAFIQAGANNVMMSLWSVSDNSTAVLMKEFYRNVLNTNGKANKHANNFQVSKALRQAKLSLINKGHHPVDWAPFILSGEE